ncbi:hypothetical protein VINI7043_27570 [Vibrio nigripulchritudo ATCC 27043]|nr:hypothetical protein VINI7043_27570 [Vibrio nigripulchritudo ATCC 27043]KJY81249.1 hypothetical protein TW74_02905 [Vibrio nigripulchritudo]CCN35705.1 hypothetical protein VIBNIAM115_1920035 [Vibrio nigripulchritudo AM115]
MRINVVRISFSDIIFTIQRYKAICLNSSEQANVRKNENVLSFEVNFFVGYRSKSHIFISELACSIR